MVSQLTVARPSPLTRSVRQTNTRLRDRGKLVQARPSGLALRATLTTQGLERTLYRSWSARENVADRRVVSRQAFRPGVFRACGAKSTRVSWWPGETRRSSNRRLLIRGLSWSLNATPRRRVVAEQRGQRVVESRALPNNGVHPTACAAGFTATSTGEFGARRG